MRPWIILIAVTILGTGCTHTALERRTVKQASTLTDLQYKQVMDNLAMFAGNPEAMPWHVKIKGGLIQIADQGNVTLGAEFPIPVVGEAVTKLFPSAGAQRGIVGQWDVDPATDPDELEMLHLAYRKAVRPDDPSLRQEILEKICELSVRFDVLPKKETIQSILTETKDGREGLETLNRIIDGLRLEARESQRKISMLKGHIANLPVDKPELISEKAKLEKERDEWDAALKFTVEQYWVLKDLLPKTAENTAAVIDFNAFLAESKVQSPDQRKVQSPPKSSPTRGRERIGKLGPQDDSDTMLRILTAVHDACAPGYLPRTDIKWETERNAALIDQAEDKIRKLEKLLDPSSPFHTPWLNCGQKKDVPKCACYVGHYRDCLGDRYVWVTPDGLKTLREFTLVILTLAPIEKQDMVSGRGAAFSPTFR